ncbi:MAG TPA: hypothetical protein VH186_02535 [Chloroflexia bacterium]|nr:hypothetical protein [Chloroflexia bacterium]
MSEQSQEQDLSSTVQELMAQLIQVKAELDRLKAHSQALPQSVAQSKAKVEVSTTRRNLLRRLAGGLVAGLAVGGIGASLPQPAEAKLSSNPTGNGLSGRVGMLVMPPGASVSGTMGGGSTNKVGLLVSGDTSFNVNAIAPTVNSAIIAYDNNNGSTIVGLSQTGIAIYGQTDSNYAVRGVSTSSYGVYGTTSNTSNTSSSATAGVLGTSTGNYDAGVKGTNDNLGYGVYGKCDGGNGVLGTSDNGYGVFGLTTNGNAIRGLSFSSTGYAGYFSGKVEITGTLAKGGGSFKIDHPLDPENKYLYHSFVESPDMLNIYNGIVTMDEHGEATVEMADWFEALNFDFRYQLTAIGASMPNLFIAEEIKERKFKIAGGQAGQKVSWMVTGIRQDAWAKAHRIPVEQDKNAKERGKYLHPALYGKSEEMSVQPGPQTLKSK